MGKYKLLLGVLKNQDPKDWLSDLDGKWSVLVVVVKGWGDSPYTTFVVEWPSLRELCERGFSRWRRGRLALKFCSIF